MSKITLLGIDLAKTVFQLQGVDAEGKVVIKRRLRRNQLFEFICNLPKCTIAMEACGGANYWARKFSSFGHEVKLISPKFVKPYVKTNKNDYNDVDGICEAASRPTMRFITPKTISQQDIQSLHRIRSRCIKERTAIVNQVRGLLMEYGIIIPQGIHKVRKLLPDIFGDSDNELSSIGRRCINDLYQQLVMKDEKIAEYELLLKSIFKENEACQRISKIEGVGLMTATAIIACVGNAKEFENGRHMAAFFGLVPKQFSSGNKERLLGISKRGDAYIRYLLVHGARSAIIASATKEDQKSKWIQSIKERRGANKAAVALANKNARTIWSLLSNGTEYQKAA